MTNFSDRLKKYRHEKRMTQQELADLLGVSNKTVSRWESDGGYPDVSMLVPLARALGVTVDDLLDGERPIRTLTRADWQNLLSFGLALGGGVLFFLFDLFMPMVVCYLAYLGCMAYGVYLQKYYAYQSRWFFLSNAVMNLSVNFSLAGKIISGLATATVTIDMGVSTDVRARLLWWMVGHQFLVQVIVFILALVITVITQRFVLQWSRGTLDWKSGPGYRLRIGRPTSVRKLVPVLIPAAHLFFWASYGDGNGLPIWAARYQDLLFVVLVALSILFCLLLFRKKVWRKWRFSALGLAVISAATRMMANGSKMLNIRNGLVFTYRELTDHTYMIRFTVRRPEQMIFLAVLMVIWLLLCFLRIEKKEIEHEE